MGVIHLIPVPREPVAELVTRSCVNEISYIGSKALMPEVALSVKDLIDFAIRLL